MVRIAQASIDERGKISGGQAGNQNGRELNTRSLWNNNWLSLIVWKDAGRGRECAQQAMNAVGNPFVGYDQSERNTLFHEAKKVGFDLSRIKIACETDCSALGGTCGIAAGAPEDLIYIGGNLCYTGNIAERFERTGLVTVYRGLSYNDYLAKAAPGSILTSSGHTVIITDGADIVTSPSAPTGATGIYVDGQWGVATTRLTQTVLDTTVDGIVSGQDRGDMIAINRGGLEASSWKIGSGGSDMVRELQKLIGVDLDRHFGVDSCRGLQAYHGTTQDGFISPESLVVKAHQRWLNEKAA